MVVEWRISEDLHETEGPACQGRVKKFLRVWVAGELRSQGFRLGEGGGKVTKGMVARPQRRDAPPRAGSGHESRLQAGDHPGAHQG